MLLLKSLRYFKNLLVPIIVLVAILFFGIAGYMVLEDYSFLDAMYMTVITLSTVGYGEVNHLDLPGKIFTIVLIMLNIATFTFFLTLLSRYLLDGELMKQYKQMKMENAIKNISRHVIICGFGRNGTESAHILHMNRIPFVVIEEKHGIPEGLDYPVEYFLRADATKDDVLQEAGIEHARAIITSLPVDADNLFVVLTARQLNPKIKIVARASQDSSVNKLKVAGADYVIMPDKIGGAHMATLTMIPDVAEVLSLMATRINEQFLLTELISRKDILLEDLDLWNNSGCTVLGVKYKDDYVLNPGPEYQIKPGERLIVMGSEKQITKAKSLL